MYAIVEINGQQFKAEAGKKLFVHHIKGAQNDTIAYIYFNRFYCEFREVRSLRGHVFSNPCGLNRVQR